MSQSRPRILLAVTADQSLVLLKGFPAYLAGRGWDVHVVASPGPMLDALASDPTVTPHPLPMRREPSLFADLCSLLSWVRLLREVRPDITSVGTPKAGLLGGIAACLTRVPRRVYLLRGLRLETSTGLQRRILTTTERISIAASHRVVAVSESLRHRAIELGLVPAKKIMVVGGGSSNGVVASAFAPSQFSAHEVQELRIRTGLKPGVPVIGFVGRLTRDKGLAELSAACESLANKGLDFQLLVVGGADTEGDGAALDPVRRSGRTIVEVGHVENTAIYYQLMDVFCLPTHREGFPNVVLEAGAAQLPTVTTDATGAIDSVIEGNTGFIAEVGSAESLAGKLDLVLSSPELRRKLGSNARQHVALNFARDAVWARLADFYTDQLAPGLPLKGR